MSTPITQMSNPAAVAHRGYRAYAPNVATAFSTLISVLFGSRPGSGSQASPQEPAWTPDASQFQSNQQQMPNLSAELRFLASRG